jgi:hypothetical protein
MNKSRRMRWAVHVAGMRDKRCIHGFGVETRGKETNFKVLGVDGRIILK